MGCIDGVRNELKFEGTLLLDDPVSVGDEAWDGQNTLVIILMFILKAMF